MTESTIQQRIPVSIQDELRTSYLDYAMSVIIGRAIPDVRDGLKPVHRRILYSMQEQGITHSGSFKKCARVVGDVLGKYHPHGDLAVYDAMVRMAQDFSLRAPLVDGQGNYGSIDGDSAAAMRYTEAKLTALAADMLSDLDKDTVDFIPNYDDSEREPSVLPAKFPQLLVNGSGGIAVGMATNIPPHNLGEVVDATIALIDNPDILLAELIDYMPGPDFPTGALIYGRSGIHSAYSTGRGSVVMRAKTHTEPIPGSNDREMIVVTEVTYQCNKARVVARIAELMRDKRIEGISEIRDESNREGIRVVVELRKDVFPQVVLNHLFRLTALQSTFGVINLSIVDGKPRVLDLKETLLCFVEHRREVVRRRTRFELTKAEARKEIVEGLGMATSDIDAIVSTIRASADVEEARARLMTLKLGGLGEFLRRAGRPEEECTAADARGDYQLSERQAKAILEMRLARLTGLEREKLATEYGSLCGETARLSAILSDDALLMQMIVDDLREVKEKHADERRTEIVESEAEIHIEDLIQVEDMAVAISHLGYIKRTSVSNYRAQRRGGKGRSGMDAREEDWVKELFVASTHSYVFFFSNHGKLYVKKVYEIPEAAPNARGRAIVNFVGLDQAEKETVAAITPVTDFEEGKYIVTLTRRGQVKKTALTDYRNYRETGIIGVRIDEDDELLGAAITDGTSEILVGTRRGMSIRFSEKNVRPMGRATMGVKAIDLSEGDHVVGMGIYNPGDQVSDRVLTVCELGYGKQTPIDKFPLQGRGGKGVKMIETSDRNGPVVGLGVVAPSDQLIVMTDRGQTLRTAVEQIRETGRIAQGVAIMRVAEEERIVAIEIFAEDEDDSAEGDDDSAEGDDDSAEGDLPSESAETATAEGGGPGAAQEGAGQGESETATDGDDQPDG
jgi:DNA gyrase subunit A